MTFSMWAERSASRSSIWRGSVQTWPVTRASSKSARCMNAPKFAADADRVDDREPDLARRQARQEPEHRRLEHADRRRPGPRRGASISRLARSGKGSRAGKVNVGRDALPQPGVGRDARRAARSRSSRDLAEPDDRRDRARGAGGRPRPGRPSGGRARRPRGRPRRASAATRAIPSRQRVGHRVPGGLVAGPDLLLEGLVLLVELPRRRPRAGRGSRPSGARRPRRPRASRAAGSVWISTDLLGVDLVDLAEPLVAAGPRRRRRPWPASAWPSARSSSRRCGHLGALRP